MSEYKIFSDPRESYDAVKQGWSWPAFMFTFWWALIKKMYVLAFSIIALNTAIYLIQRNADLNIGLREHTWLFILTLGITTLLGVYGNRWRERNLLSRGYNYLSTHKASDDQDAISLYFKSKET
jgi:hypothetical protein